MFGLRVITLVLSFFTATSLAYPTWWLGVFNFRCKPPHYVESYSDTWKEWRVSSICAPGTCCSNWANTGPLCTADACEMADKERERLTAQHNANEAQRKKKSEAEEAENKEQKEKEAEASWKAKEAIEDAAREKALQAEKAEKEAQLKP